MMEACQAKQIARIATTARAALRRAPASWLSTEASTMEHKQVMGGTRYSECRSASYNTGLVMKTYIRGNDTAKARNVSCIASGVRNRDSLFFHTAEAPTAAARSRSAKMLSGSVIASQVTV